MHLVGRRIPLSEYGFFDEPSNGLGDVDEMSVFGQEITATTSQGYRRVPKRV